MNLLRFPIIKITFWLVFGIIAAPLFSFQFIDILIACGVFVTLLWLLLRLIKNHLSHFWWMDLVMGLAIFSFGVFSVYTHDQRNFEKHYTNDFVIEPEAEYNVVFRIHEKLKPSQYHTKYTVELLSLNEIEVCGRLLLNIAKDSTIHLPDVDHIYFANTGLQKNNKPLNPFQFDYSKYLERQHIYHSIYLEQNELFKIDSSKHTFYGYASVFRQHINLNLQKHHLQVDVQAVINALLLGQRQDVSEDLYENYAQAGAIHILAISGLHIGIILLLLNKIFHPLEWLKNGRWIKVILIILILWSYALIAGLSASVIRACMMFTIFAIGMNLKRPANTYNTLAVSMFILLLINPGLLFEVGFQMSYLAVLSIITLMPMLTKWWTPKNKILNFFWRIFAVTLSAQIGVLPLSLFYFHQFPGLFVVSNLVIIPCLGFILGIGMLVLLLAYFNWLPEFLMMVYAKIIVIMNAFVQWIAQQEAFLFQNISFDMDHTLWTYALIIGIIFFLKKRSINILFGVLAIIVFFQAYLILKTYNSSTSEFIIFHKSRHTIIGERHNSLLRLYHNFTHPIKEEKIIVNFKVGAAIDQITQDSIQNVFDVSGKKLLLIDSLGIYKTSFKPELVLLTNSPKINLDRLIDQLQPERIISDGSNYRSYQRRWKATCEAKKIPFHQTSEKGAFIISY